SAFGIAPIVRARSDPLAESFPDRNALAGDGFLCVEAALHRKRHHPHPGLPLEGEGDKRALTNCAVLALPFKGEAARLRTEGSRAANARSRSEGPGCLGEDRKSEPSNGWVGMVLHRRCAMLRRNPRHNLPASRLRSLRAIRASAADRNAGCGSWQADNRGFRC